MTRAALSGARKIKTGVSVTVHFTGPAADAALNFDIGADVSIVRAPTTPKEQIDG